MKLYQKIFRRLFSAIGEKNSMRLAWCIAALLLFPSLVLFSVGKVFILLSNLALFDIKTFKYNLKYFTEGWRDTL